jgi:hypothetical protein
MGGGLLFALGEINGLNQKIKTLEAQVINLTVKDFIRR